MIFTAPKYDAADRQKSIDFAATEITGEIRGIRSPAGDDWRIISLTDGRCVTGTFGDDEVSSGVTYRFFGNWQQHNQYGPQFKCESHVLADKQGRMGIVSYLARGNGLDLSETDARKLYDAFGGTAIEKVRTDPDAAGKIIGADKAKRASIGLRRMLADEPTRIELFQIFGGRGIPKNAIEACIDKWGATAPARIKRDPFKLLTAEIPGIGFKRADALYLDLGLPPLRLKRQMIAAWHALATKRDGDTWHKMFDAEKAVIAAVESEKNARFSKAIELGIRAGWLVRREDAAGEWITEREKANAEERLARHVKRIMKHEPVLPTYGYGMTNVLTEHQLGIVMELVRNPLFILAGTPGTGKTTSAAQILIRAMHQIGSKNIAVVAPTGKAAVRITESMERFKLPFKATTIHTKLGVGGFENSHWRFLRDESVPLDEMLILCDECSMDDTELLASLLAAIPRGGNFIMIGDPYQLPPVGHGAPLRDMIAAGVPCGLLTEIMRNSGAIVEACAAIKDGERPKVYEQGNIETGENLIHINCGDSSEERLTWIAQILKKIRADGVYDPVWDVQILTATNAIRKEFNSAMQDGLNPQPVGVPQENPTFRVGDKIICLKNTKAKLMKPLEQYPRKFGDWTPDALEQAYLANGDMGRVLAVKKTAAIVHFFAPDRVVQIMTDRPKKGKDGKDETWAGDFDLAYTITVHKSQGSEQKIVIVVLEDSRVTSREHLYTAISRAKDLCILIGSMQTAMKQVIRVGLADRKTFLVELLKDNGNGSSSNG